MKNKQSAVEWAEDEMSKLYYEAGNITFSEYHKKRIGIWQQAKTMEKEQIINAWNDCMTGEIFELKQEDSGELYYKNVYGR